MTAFEKYQDTLKLFGIPSGDAGAGEDVRKILARLLAARSLRLAQLQTARDIFERAKEQGKEQDLHLYLFLAAIFLSEGQGNAYMKKDAVRGLLVDRGYIDDPKKAGVEENAAYEAFVAKVLGDIDWDVAAARLDKDILEFDKGRWYFQRNKKSIDKVNDRLKKFVKANKEMGDVAPEIIGEAAKFSGFELNLEQKEALRAAVGNRFTVITGGPGTGKTTTVCAILRALLEVHKDWTEKDIAIAAPTGRAAQRMSEAILDQCAGLEGERVVDIAGKLEGTTIHRLLGGYAPNWKHTEKNQLEKRVVIVDETSMVDIYLMHALIATLKEDARLILLGDADQLPSVDTGAVLGDLTKFGMDENLVKRLAVCERAKGEVSDVAQEINLLPLNDEDAARRMVNMWLHRQIQAEALPCTEQIAEGKSKFQWLCPKADIKKDGIQELYRKWMSGNELAKKAHEIEKTDKSLGGVKSDASEALFKELNRRRILTLVRESWYGVKEANAFLLKEAKNAAGVRGDYLSMVGVPIMVTHNTPERKLFNGDVGVTVRGPHGMVVLFPRGAKTIACPVALLPEHELAYAMTVHKSQGSEFENVMVVLPDDEKHPLLNRQIVYTGITRAKKRAVIVGNEGALTAALERKIERDTGIALGGATEAGNKGTQGGK